MAVIQRFRAGDRQTENGESGFTLLEVLFAMTIMAVGLLTVGVAQLSAVKMTSRSRSLSQAMYVAQERLDEFLALPANDTFFTTALTDAVDPAGPVDVNSNDNDATTFTRRWTVVPDSPSLGLTTVRITVSWDSASTASHEIELQAIRRRS